MTVTVPVVKVLIHTGALLTVKVTAGVTETIVFSRTEGWISIGNKETVTTAAQLPGPAPT